MSKMRNAIAVLVVAALVGFAFTTSESVKDAGNDSTIKWLGKKVTGQHEGTMNFAKVDINFDEAGTLTSANFAVDMNSVTNTDLDQGSAAKLIGHLKSADFFDVENHPYSMFKATSIKSMGKGMYEITGDLSIKNITNEITFKANATNVDGKVSASAKVIVDRAKFDVRYGSGSFFDGLGDKVIYDDFELDINIVK
jgi:polyisoprenoid-binding protein YceI